MKNPQIIVKTRFYTNLHTADRQIDMPIPAKQALRQWRTLLWNGLGSGFDGWMSLRETAVPLAPDQPHFPELTGNEFLSYRELQSLASRFPGLELAMTPAEGKKGGGGRAGGKGAKGGEGGKPRVVIQPAVNKAGSRGNQRTRIWQPWPAPKKEHVSQAQRVLQALLEEAVEHARETAPVRWSPAKLAVYGRAGQPDRARVWEQEGLPRLLLAIDDSGSMSSQVNAVRAFGSAIAAAVPWLLVMGAPNGCPAPLYTDWSRKVIPAILDGENWLPPGMSADPTVWYDADLWPGIVRAANVAGIIYVGDWEDAFLSQFPGMRRATLSIMHCAALADVAPAWGAQKRPWPVVVGVDGFERSLRALEMVLAQWRTE